ncbi:hypothetical protein ACSRUE_31685 [Sorangium sp. KYC3313]|uniref:hypothetical protein n=1 Tax=Sorangium sp. KYC3313 TaxID=3449740 RepID=UPI003F89ADBE
MFAGRQVLDLPNELVPGRAGDVRTLRTFKVPIYDDDALARRSRSREHAVDESGAPVAHALRPRAC